MLPSCLSLSWRRPLLYRNQSIDLLCKSMDWFLYNNGLRHERVKVKNRNIRKKCEICLKLLITITISRRYFGVFIVNFEHISHLFLRFLLLTLNTQILAGLLQYNFFFFFFQKQPFRGVLLKRCCTSAWMFFCKIASYFQNTFSREHRWMAASIFFYSGFLSWTFTIHRTAVEAGGYFINSSLSFSPASQILKH